MNRRQLQELSREELVARAERLGVMRPRVLTQAELIDEILSRTARTQDERKKARGFLGRARDLLASVIELGLHLPEAAKAMREKPAPRTWPSPQAPLPTVTLAEIYAAQGHLSRAITILDEVLSNEPDHAEARALRDRFTVQASSAEAPKGAPPKDEDESMEAESAAQEALSVVEARDDAKRAEAPRVVEAKTAEIAEESGPASEPSALPERYDVDEVVAVATDPKTLFLYWEVRPTTLAHARVSAPDGKVALRVITIVPSWDGPEVTTRDFVVDALSGEQFVHDLPPSADVRVSVGWLFSKGFDPFAVGMELQMPRGEPSSEVARTTARWTKEPEPHELALVRMEMFRGFAPRGSREELDGLDAPQALFALASGTPWRPRSLQAAVLATSDGEPSVVHEWLPFPTNFAPVRVVTRFGGASDLGFGGAS